MMWLKQCKNSCVLTIYLLEVTGKMEKKYIKWKRVLESKGLIANVNNSKVMKLK